MKPRQTPPTRGLVAVVWHVLFVFFILLREASFVVGGRRDYEFIQHQGSMAICLKRSTPNNTLEETREVTSGRIVDQSVSDLTTAWPQCSAKPIRNVSRLSIARRLESVALLVAKAIDLSPHNGDMLQTTSPGRLAQILWRIWHRVEIRLSQTPTQASGEYYLARIPTSTGQLFQLRQKGS